MGIVPIMWGGLSKLYSRCQFLGMPMDGYKYYPLFELKQRLGEIKRIRRFVFSRLRGR